MRKFAAVDFQRGKKVLTGRKGYLIAQIYARIPLVCKFQRLFLVLQLTGMWPQPWRS